MNVNFHEKTVTVVVQKLIKKSQKK